MKRRNFIKNNSLFEKIESILDHLFRIFDEKSYLSLFNTNLIDNFYSCKQRVTKNLLFFSTLFDQRSFSSTDLINFVEENSENFSECAKTLLTLDENKVIAEIIKCHHQIPHLLDQKNLQVFSTKYMLLLLQVFISLKSSNGIGNSSRLLFAILKLDTDESDFIFDLVKLPEGKRKVISSLVDKYRSTCFLVEEIKAVNNMKKKIIFTNCENQNSFDCFLRKEKQKKLKTISEVVGKFERFGLQLSKEDILYLFMKYHFFEIKSDSLTIEQFLFYFKKSILEEISSLTFIGLDKIIIFNITLLILLVHLINFVFSQTNSPFMITNINIFLIFVFFAIINTLIYLWIFNLNYINIQQQLHKKFDFIQEYKTRSS